MTNVLIVDDDDMLREVLANALNRSGYDVVNASDGASALKMLAHKSVTVVVVDLVMPNMDGLELIQQIRRHDPRIRIVAISGWGPGRGRLYLRGAEHFGADMSLAKPFKISQLVEAISGQTAVPSADPVARSLSDPW